MASGYIAKNANFTSLLQLDEIERDKGIDFPEGNG